MIETNNIKVYPSGTLSWQEKTYKCALGKSGITSQKQEGDGATPVGRYALKGVLYRSDRLAAPETSLPLSELKTTDGWCDDPDHADYNKKISLPHPGSTEELWRKDGVYDVIVILGHNEKPIIKGKGSAIFMHIAKTDYSPTEGCIALSQEDLLEILKSLMPDNQIEILPA